MKNKILKLEKRLFKHEYMSNVHYLKNVIDEKYLGVGKSGRKMIKNIVFDLGNVILKGSPNIVLDQIEIDKKQYESIKNNFFKDWKALDLGKSTLREQLEKCKFDFEIDSEIEEKLLHYYKYRSFNIEILELINELKEKGYKIYILSNNNTEAEEYLLELPDFEVFDGWIFSCDYQIMKPDSKIYNILFETYNLKPEECFFVDDSKRNVETGEELGMTGFVLDHENNNINELRIELEKVL